MEKIYALYDVKAELFGNPFLSDTDESVRRMSLDLAIHGGDNLISQHPEDFEVYCIGQFDKHTGKGDFYDVRGFVCRIGELVDSYRISFKSRDNLDNITPNSLSDSDA